MKLHWPWGRPNATGFITVYTRSCVACADCVRACPHAVLGMVAFWRHRHVRVERPEACTGCRKCLQTCQHGAIADLARRPRLPRDAGDDCGTLS
jgi:ferredoxin